MFKKGDVRICRYVFLLLQERPYLTMEEIASDVGKSVVGLDNILTRNNAYQFLAKHKPESSWLFKEVWWVVPNQDGKVWSEYFLREPSKEHKKRINAQAKWDAQQREAEARQRKEQAEAEKQQMAMASRVNRCGARNKNHAVNKAPHQAWANFDHVCGGALNHVGDHKCSFCDRSWTNDRTAPSSTQTCGSVHWSQLPSEGVHTTSGRHICRAKHIAGDTWHECEVKDCGVIWKRGSLFGGEKVRQPVKTVDKEVVVAHKEQESESE